jgi:hypothetical protein
MKKLKKGKMYSLFVLNNLKQIIRKKGKNLYYTEKEEEFDLEKCCKNWRTRRKKPRIS